MKISGVGFTSALIYTGISLIAVGIFLAITVAGEYTWVARIGGAVWVFMLSMIVLIPVIMPRVKKRLGI